MYSAKNGVTGDHNSCVAPLQRCARQRARESLYFERQRQDTHIVHTNMSGKGDKSGRLATASKKVQQQRLSKEERLAMESWMKLGREYPPGARGKAMTNLRWINGGSSKGLKSMNVDSKDATKDGAYISLANYVNANISSKVLKTQWTSDTAMAKFKNMKTSFKRICKDNQFPLDEEWTDAGKSKEELAQEIERITKIRRAKCASYDVLWAELQHHPSINPAGRFESSVFQDEDDAEEDEDVDAEAEADGQSDDAENSDDDEVNDREEVDRSPRAGTARSSSTMSNQDRGDGGGKRRKTQGKAASPSPRKPASPAKKTSGKGVSAEKFKFKKGSSAPRHRDITAAYIAMKAEWNRMWLRVQILKERREVYFICRDLNMTPAQIKAAFEDIGLGKLPAYLPSWGEDPMDDAFTGPPNHDAEHELRGSDACDGDTMRNDDNARRDDEESDED